MVVFGELSFLHRLETDFKEIYFNKKELSKKIRIEWPKDEYMSVKTKIERSLSNKNGDMGL